MTVMMVRHVGRHIGLIVIQINRFRLGVIRREMAVVIRRRPCGIYRSSVDIPHRWTFDKHRTNDIVVAVQVSVTDDLYVQHVRTAFCHQCGYVLKDARSQTCLNQQRMIIAVTSLYYAQIINPSVTIKIQVVNHITTGIKKLLEILYRM